MKEGREGSTFSYGAHTVFNKQQRFSEFVVSLHCFLFLLLLILLHKYRYERAIFQTNIIVML